MKISNVNFIKEKYPTFKAIYVQDDIRLGEAQTYEGKGGKFLKKDALLLNEIATKYPYQDCFIKKGKRDLPIIEFREHPTVVPVFNEYTDSIYQHFIYPYDKKNPSVPLILYPNSNINMFIGVTSDFSLNPSLPYTVRAGYDLHKRLLEKKYQILDAIGPADEPNIGKKNILEKSKELIEDVENTLSRYLLECAGNAISNREEAEEIFPNINAKIENGLTEKRKIDITKPIDQHPNVETGNFTAGSRDVCDLAMEEFPNVEENKSKLNKVKELLFNFKLFMVDPENEKPELKE